MCTYLAYITSIYDLLRFFIKKPNFNLFFLLFFLFSSITDVLTNGANFINNNNKIDFNPNFQHQQQRQGNFMNRSSAINPMNLIHQNPSPLMYETMQNCSVGYPQQMYNHDFTADLDSYLLPADNNPLPNLSINMADDLRNLNVDELFQNSINQHQQQLQQPREQGAIKMNGSTDSTIFNINRSTMDNNSHQRFLDLIKQQQNQKMMVTSQDSISNQSSPPPTPSSDWSDIPSPISSINDFDLKFSPLSPAVPTTQKATQPSTTSQSAVGKPKKKPRKPYSTKSGKPRLYRFLKDILNDPKQYPCIEWVNKSTGTFKFLDSSEVARLWGFRKNKPAMKYENFARSLRTYIAKGILKKPRNKLVYSFAQPDSE